MKKIFLYSFLIISFVIFSEDTIEDKIELIIDSEISSELMDSALDISKKSMTFSGIDVPDLDEFLIIIQPYMKSYLEKLKGELKVVYLESFTEKEINAYYQFISSSSGKSFMKKQPQLANETFKVSFSLIQEMLKKISEDIVSNPELFEGSDLFIEEKRNPLIEDNLMELENNNFCSYCDLSFQSFEDKNLNGADLSGSNLQGVDFSNSSLLGVNFIGAQLADALFEGANLTDASFTDANLDSTDFTDAIVEGVIFEDAWLCNTIFSHGIENRDC